MSCMFSSGPQPDGYHCEPRQEEAAQGQASLLIFAACHACSPQVCNQMDTTVNRVKKRLPKGQKGEQQQQQQQPAQQQQQQPAQPAAVQKQEPPKQKWGLF